jgi:hypothetical protein
VRFLRLGRAFGLERTAATGRVRAPSIHRRGVEPAPRPTMRQSRSAIGVAHPRSQGVRYARAACPQRVHLGTIRRLAARIASADRPPVAVGAGRSDPPDRPTGRPVSPTARTLRGMGITGSAWRWLPRPTGVASQVGEHNQGFMGRAGLRHPTALQHARIGGHVGGLLKSVGGPTGTVFKLDRTT